MTLVKFAGIAALGLVTLATPAVAQDVEKGAKVFRKCKACHKMEEGKEETLATFLKKPKDLVKGTKMAFAGLRKDDQIADVIAYLATNGE